MKIVKKVYNLNNKLNKKIVLISDIHYYSQKNINHLNKILHKIKDIMPDYICIPGDFIDSANIFDFDLFIEWLSKLSNVAKVIMTLGNHEFYMNKPNKEYKLNDIYINKIKNIDNLNLLINENKVIDNINFIGLVLPIEHYMFNAENEEDFKKYVKNIKTNKKYYNILLCHSPANISKKNILEKINIDLVFCGHMHGGVVPRFLRFLFGTRGLISPQKKIFPKYAYGNIKTCGKNVVITSGISVLPDKYFGVLKNIYSSEVVEINL